MALIVLRDIVWRDVATALPVTVDVVDGVLAIRIEGASFRFNDKGRPVFFVPKPEPVAAPEPASVAEALTA